MSTPNIMTFLPQSKLGIEKIEKNERESNSVPHPEYEYLSGSAFLVILTFPNK